MGAAFGLAVLAGALVAVSTASALDEGQGEQAAIADCDQRLCSILLQRNRNGGDLKCALTKTWAKSKIKQADTASVSWGFGDARCTIDLNMRGDG
jgi:hypothetical protein